MKAYIQAGFSKRICLFSVDSRCTLADVSADSDRSNMTAKNTMMTAQKSHI